MDVPKDALFTNSSTLIKKYLDNLNFFNILYFLLKR